MKHKPKQIAIEQITDNPAVNLALDTLKINKQALLFTNSKKSAEKTAEDLAKKIKTNNPEHETLSYDALNVLQNPTIQCQRLANCLRKGVAFHHAGLAAKQRELIEDNFRTGKIKIISCTPTLCLSKDTMIWHNTSETEVSKFENSNPIFALSGNRLIHMKAQKIQKIKNSSKLVQISSVSGYSIKTTQNHKFLIKRKNKKQIVKAKYINKKDRIATIWKLNIEKVSNPKIKDFILDHYIDFNYEFDQKLSYFIGVMLGDGYSGAETNNKKIKYKGSPSIVGIDEEIFSNGEEICNILNLNCRKIKNRHGTPQLILGKNKWFREFLVRCGVEKRERKHISRKLMSMNLDNIASLLKGLFDTDGFVQKGINVGFSNTSEILIKQMQKLLLRFSIVCRIRKRKAGLMKIYEKEYPTLPQFELTICQKKSIIDFYKYIGFDIKRKQNNLINLIAKIGSNLNYVSCNKCKYKIYKDLFLGRTKDQKEWGQIKLKVIKLLGEKKELGSRELRKILGKQHKKKDRRLNHHYEFIKKRRIGNRSDTEWLWSLNLIGKWFFENIIKKKKSPLKFFGLKECPFCKNELNWVVKKGWRDSDFEGDIFWDKIRELKEIECEEDVYDIVLPNKPKNEHMFVANGFIVHNSAGVDLPSFRTILKDLRRFSSPRGMVWIPVLEYEQMAGRSGRPSFDEFGEAVAVAETQKDKKSIYKRYICGAPEDIHSKLAVEPVLRTYVLSLIATGFVGCKKELLQFFEKTFWAHQFGDMEEIESIISKVLCLLEEYKFIEIAGSAKREDFVSAAEIADENIKATELGTRVAQLYIDPLTAFKIIEGLKKASGKIEGKTEKEANGLKELNEFSFLSMISNQLEIRPFLKVKMKEYELIQQRLAEYEKSLIIEEPTLYDPDYDEFLCSIKTALFFDAWCDEKDEVYLLENFDIRPGEIMVKLNIADWLLYSAEELAKLLKLHILVKHIMKTRFRLKYGIKEELLALIRLEGIGRARARKLYNHSIKDIGDVKKADIVSLAQIIGKSTAISIKKQVGQEFSEEKIKVKENKRKGQISLRDY